MQPAIQEITIEHNCIPYIEEAGLLLSTNDVMEASLHISSSFLEASHTSSFSQFQLVSPSPDY